MFNVFKCGTFSKLLSIHYETPIIQIRIVRRSLNVCSFSSVLTLARPASYRVCVLLYQVKRYFYTCVYSELSLEEDLGLFTG